MHHCFIYIINLQVCKDADSWNAIQAELLNTISNISIILTYLGTYTNKLPNSTEYHGLNEDFLKFRIDQYVGKIGAPGTIRTCDPQYRKLWLSVYRDRLQ